MGWQPWSHEQPTSHSHLRLRCRRPLREVIQAQVTQLEPLQQSKLQLALRPDCMSEAMKDALAAAVRDIDGFTQQTTADLIEAVVECAEQE